MTRLDPVAWITAASLAAIAGFVDAVAYLHLGGLFVSFMSGNSTRLGVGLATSWPEALAAFRLILLFVAGVALGSLLNPSGERGGAVRLLWVVAAILTGAALLAHAGMASIAVGCLAVAMGAENAVFRSRDGIAFGITYITGALAKVGESIADALRGMPRLDWLSYLVLWVGLIGGASVGAFMFSRFGLNSIGWAACAAGAAALLASVQRFGGRSEP